MRGPYYTAALSVAITFGVVTAVKCLHSPGGWPQSSSAGGLDIVVDTSAGGANNHDAFCSLGEAITAANNDTPVGSCVADPKPATHDLFSLNPGDTTINVTTALPNITSPVTINGKTWAAEVVWSWREAQSTRTA